MVNPRILTVTAQQIAEARAPRDGYPVPVLGHLPEGAILISSVWDRETTELHIIYRMPEDEADDLAPEAAPSLTEEVRAVMAAAMDATPIPHYRPMQAFALEQSARILPEPSVERIAMVAHELIRAWRLACGKGPDLPGWPDLRPHDRADAVDALRCAAVGVAAPHALPATQARVEQTLREVTLQAFSLKP